MKTKIKIIECKLRKGRGWKDYEIYTNKFINRVESRKGKIINFIFELVKVNEGKVLIPVIIVHYQEHEKDKMNKKQKKAMEKEQKRQDDLDLEDHTEMAYQNS